MIHVQPFQHVSFLCRDYGNFTYGCPFEENVEEAKEIEERYFANTANGENKVYGNVIDDDEQEKEAQLLEMFKIISSFALPHPGKSVASRSSTGQLNSIDEFFRKLAGYYIESIFEKIEPLQVTNKNVLAKDFSSYLFIILLIIQIYD